MTERFHTSPVSYGSKVKLTCTTDSAFPPATIMWSRNGSHIESNEATFTITTWNEIGEVYGNTSISTLSFIANDEHRGMEFACNVKDNSSITPEKSTLVLEGLYTSINTLVYLVYYAVT